MPLAGGSATFTIANTHTETTFFICDSSSTIALRTLSLQPIVFEPKFLFRATPSTLTFNAVTPAFSQVELRSYGDCTTGDAAFSGSLTSNRSVTVTMQSSVYYFVCVRFTSTVTGQLVTLNAGSVLVTEAVNFTPNSGIRGDNGFFELSGAAPPFTKVIISSTSDCATQSAGPLLATGTFGKTVAFTLTLPRGEYEFCIETPLNSNIYVSAGKLRILEFGISPSTLFRGRATTMRSTKDSPSNSPVVLTGTSTCSPPFLAGPSTPAGATSSWTWTLSFGVGSYTACVQKSGSTEYVNAGPVQLVEPYIVTVGTLPSVVGIANAVSVSPLPSMRVLLTTDTGCLAPVVDITTSNSQGSFVLSTASPDVLTVCVETADGTGRYSVGSVSARSFRLTHPPVLDGRLTSFDVDPSAPVNSNIRFSSNEFCNSSLGTYVLPVDRRLEAFINTSGIVYVCFEALS